MSELQGEPDFDQDVQEAAEAFYEASVAMADVKAYVLDEHDIENFKQAQYALRALNEAFDQHRQNGDDS
jgi:hypothetical protein